MDQMKVMNSVGYVVFMIFGRSEVPCVKLNIIRLIRHISEGLCSGARAGHGPGLFAFWSGVCCAS
jgi:hypothetical protein